MFFFMFYGIRYCLSNIASRSVLLQFNLWSSPICNWCLWWSWKSSFEANESFTWRSIRAMTYSSYKSRVWPLYKKFIWIKIDDIYILKIGKFMHSLHWGRIPVNFDHLCTSVSQAHSHASCAATLAGYIWQIASTVKGKRSLKHFGPKLWDSIDPSFWYFSTCQETVQRQTG